MASNDYNIQAQEFLDTYKLKLSLEFQGFRKYFPSDKEKRNVYEFTLTNTITKKEYTGTYGDSIYNSTPKPNKYSFYVPPKRVDPSQYDILACLDIFNDTFPAFCDCFWYDSDSIQARKTYDLVIEQSIGLEKVLTLEAIEALKQIN